MHYQWSQGTLFNICYPISFSKIIGLWLDLDCQSHICDDFGLNWQSKKIGLPVTLNKPCYILIYIFNDECINKPYLCEL